MKELIQISPETLTPRCFSFYQAIQHTHPQSLLFPKVIEYKERMEALLLHAQEHALSRDLKEAHFTCSAFVFTNESKCLALFHKKLQRWLQPGGHVERDDSSPLSCALREASEESGLSDLKPLYPYPIDLDIHHIPERKGEAAHDHYDLRYAFLTQTPNFAGISEESSALHWLADQALTDWKASEDSIRRAVEVGRYLLSLYP